MLEGRFFNQLDISALPLFFSFANFNNLNQEHTTNWYATGLELKGELSELGNTTKSAYQFIIFQTPCQYISDKV